MGIMNKKMDNPAFHKDVERGTEMDVVLKKNKITITTGNQNEPSTSCRPEVCMRARQRYQAPDLSGSPWHSRKTVFLVGIIVLLIIWIIVYATLSQLKLL